MSTPFVIAIEIFSNKDSNDSSNDDDNIVYINSSSMTGLINDRIRLKIIRIMTILETRIIIFRVRGIFKNTINKLIIMSQR